MKTKLVLTAAFAVALPGILLAQSPSYSPHYVPGVEGLKGASLPPPGVYVRDYNVFYTSDRVNSDAGESAGPPGFKANVYANVPRVIWITDKKLLGGFVGVDALLPLVNTSVKFNGYDSSTFGIGDFFAESTLSWHVPQFDFSLAAGCWMPTGDSGPGTTRAGMGFWSPMLTAGATWYVDQEKTWAVSALSRYEFATESRDTHITPGQNYTLEWGVSKTLAKVWDVGAVGYLQQQITKDHGAGSDPNLDQVAAIGPEVSVAFPKQMFFISARYLYEFTAQNRTQGHTIALTLTKRL
jgi:hypothetical protein